VNPWPSLFEHAPNWGALWTAVAFAIVVAWGTAEAVTWAASHLLPRRAPTERPGSHPSARKLLRFLRVFLILALLPVVLPPTLELFGQPIRTGLKLQTLGRWAIESGLRVVFIVGLAAVLARIIAITTKRLQQALIDSQTPPSAEQQKRAATVGTLVQNVARAFIFTAAVVMILDTLNIDTKPLLASAGIVGLGLGFGAQTLVKDVISGFFLIVDNYVRVGDTAEINGISGLVEAINLRTIVLRDYRGAVHVVPSGSVTTLTNLTKDYSYAVLDVTVTYAANTDEVAALLRDIGDSVQKDPVFAPVILESIEVMGIERLGDLGVILRSRMKTLPAQQWNVTREMRRRVKQAFDAKGIQIPVTNAPPAASAAPQGIDHR
jgi:small conductance mechanosensitive channel